MPISENRDLGKYRNSNVQGLESQFMAWLWHNKSMETATLSHCKDCVDARADLSVRWAYMSEDAFSHTHVRRCGSFVLTSLQ